MKVSEKQSAKNQDHRRRPEMTICENRSKLTCPQCAMPLLFWQSVRLPQILRLYTIWHKNRAGLKPEEEARIKNREAGRQLKGIRATRFLILTPDSCLLPAAQCLLPRLSRRR